VFVRGCLHRGGLTLLLRRLSIRRSIEDALGAVGPKSSSGARYSHLPSPQCYRLVSVRYRSGRPTVIKCIKCCGKRVSVTARTETRGARGATSL
jgi:hypothetical protein